MAELYARRLEEGDELQLDFGKLKEMAQLGESVLPVVVQDSETGQVLLLAYANEAALQHTLEQGLATFWSTSRNELWVKGSTSGNTLQVLDIRVNCEQNSLLYLVRPLGEGACHTVNAEGRSRKSCYYRRIRRGRIEFLGEEQES